MREARAARVAMDTKAAMETKKARVARAAAHPGVAALHALLPALLRRRCCTATP